MGKMFRKIGDYLESKGMKDKKLLLWEQRSAGSDERALILSIPSPEADEQRYDIRAIQNFAVRDNERVVLFDKGILTDVLSGGVYELEKNARSKATSLVYVDVGDVKLQWGIPQPLGPRSKEGIQFGISGNIMISIENPKSFALNLVSKEKSFTDKKLREWIKENLTSVVRETLVKYELQEIGAIKKEEVNNAIEMVTSKMFERYGLVMHDFNVITLNVPDEYKHVIEKAAEKAGKIARTEAMMDDIEFEKALEKKKLQGDIELERLKQEKELVAKSGQVDIDSTVRVKEHKLEMADAQHERELAKITSDTAVINARTQYKETVLGAMAEYQKIFKEGLADVELDGLRTTIETGAEITKKQMDILEKVLVRVSETSHYEGLADKVDLVEFAKAEAIQIASKQPNSRAEFGTHPAPSHTIHIDSETRKKEGNELREELRKVEKQIIELDDKLLDGSISEDKHEKMLARLQERKKEIKEELGKLGF